jgi:AraC-like DNA-binding protein
MNKIILDQLKTISEEEKKILSGSPTINRSLYYTDPNTDIIDADRVLKNGRQIDIRLHTRFIHFPPHRHNYVEVIYMIQGSTTHLINHQKYILQEGDILFLSPSSLQEIEPAAQDDIAVNFMIRPSFFDSIFTILPAEETPLRSFLIQCIKGTDNRGCLLFHTKDIIPIENLLENLIWNMMTDEPNRRSLNEMTMGLLLINLMNHSEKAEILDQSYDNQLVLKLLQYIEQNYQNASLEEFAQREKTDLYTISRFIKHKTGHTYKELLTDKRMKQAAFLLKNTPLTIDEISLHIGYENTSFFHRLFKRYYGMTPRQYRFENSAGHI